MVWYSAIIIYIVYTYTCYDVPLSCDGAAGNNEVVDGDERSIFMRIIRSCCDEIVQLYQMRHPEHESAGPITLTVVCDIRHDADRRHFRNSSQFTGVCRPDLNRTADEPTRDIQIQNQRTPRHTS